MQDEAEMVRGGACGGGRGFTGASLGTVIAQSAVGLCRQGEPQPHEAMLEKWIEHAQ